jgi:hypothetical protein
VKEQTQSTVDAFRAALEETIHGTDFQNKLSAYIEILGAQGEETARKQFPKVAKHLEKCAVCRNVVEDTLYLLQEIEEEERADALKSGAQPTHPHLSPRYYPDR